MDLFIAFIETSRGGGGGGGVLFIQMFGGECHFDKLNNNLEDYP
jgi:hypothetical protein